MLLLYAECCMLHVACECCMLNLAMSLQQVAWRMQHAARVFAMEIRRGALARTRRTNRLSRSAICKCASAQYW
jgi:hypothetical protein